MYPSPISRAAKRKSALIRQLSRGVQLGTKAVVENGRSLITARLKYLQSNVIGMAEEEDEVQRLKSLVKDLELQNTALRTQKQHPHQNTGSSDHLLEQNKIIGQQRQSVSSESDGDGDCFDVSNMCSLDDDVSWLFSSPKKQSQTPDSPAPADQLSKRMLASFESPEFLPRRRALTHKLRDISEGGSPTVQSLFALRNSSLSPSTLSSPNSGQQQISSSHSNSSYNSPHPGNRVGGTTTPPRSSLHSSYDYESTGSTCENGITSNPNLESSPLLSASNPGTSTSYCTRTFTRPKKKHLAVPKHSAHKSDNDTDTEETLPMDIPVGNIDSSGNHTNEPTYTKSVKESRNRKDLAAGDSSTFVRRRNQTRTIESSAVLEAQRLMSDSPNSLDQSESDSLGALPDTTFRRREPTGNNDDKSKRESLDIQTLAKLQEQSLRDSLSAVRKASTSSAGSGGVPSLNFSDLDSSTGSLSSSNEESFSHRAEEKAMQGSGTFRIRKSPRSKPQSPTVELNGDTPIIHKSVVGTRNSAGNTSQSGRKSPQIRSSLSPRSIQVPRTTGLRTPKSSLPAPTKVKGRTSGGIPAPRSGLRAPTSSR